MTRQQRRAAERKAAKTPKYGVPHPSGLNHKQRQKAAHDYDREQRAANRRAAARAKANAETK